MGYNSLVANTTGTDNTAVGYDAGGDMTTADDCTFIGSLAGRYWTTGNGNTAVGYGAGAAQYSGAGTTGTYNSCLGFGAGTRLTSGDNNLLLGHDAGTPNAPSGQVNDEDNYVCLGDSNIATACIQVDWTVGSDKRDKTDITPFNHGLSWINKLEPVTYRWDNRDNYENGIPDGSKKQPKLNVGLLAQDELEVEKEHGFGDTPDTMLVTDLSPDGNKYGMQYSKLVPILINAVKELSAQNEALVARITVLESN